MAFSPRKAQRSKSKLRLAICGPSGSGKTLSSLLIAYGIAKDWDKIGFIDTETGSGEQYVGRDASGIRIGEYDYFPIDPPYTTAKYLEAIKGFEAMGKEVIIVDSLTHAWSGSGGLLEKKDRLTDASKSGNSYTAWGKITPEHNSLIDSILQSRSHVIGTMRSKQEYVQEKDDRGKTIVRKVGTAPVQREGMEYEFTTVIDIDVSHCATSDKDRTGVVGGLFFVPTVKTGEDMLEWLNTGVDAPHPWDKALADIKDAKDLATLKACFENAVRYARAANDVDKEAEAVKAKDEAKDRIEKASPKKKRE